MAIDFAQIHEFSESAKRANSIDELAEDFRLVIEPLGFSFFTLAEYIDIDNPPDDALSINYFPDDWIGHFVERRYYDRDPVLEIAVRRTLPFLWDEPFVESCVDKHQKQILQEASEAGLEVGLTIPINGRGFPPRTVNVAGKGPDNDPEMLHAIHLSAIYLHAAAHRIALSKKKKRPQARHLSPRERECLRWVSVGKTNWEIGCILSISENTVHYHVESAKRKLNSTTRSQAVVQAFFENQIFP